MKTIHKRLGQNKVRFGENDTMTLMLKVPKTCTSIYALMNETERKLNVIIDEAIPKDTPVNFYALRHDAHLTLSYADMIKFVESFNYKITYLSEK